MTAARPVLVDTDAFSRLFVRRSSPDDRQADLVGWRTVLTGRPVVISFQTRAEILQGALAANWGAARSAQLRAVLDRTPTVGVDDRVIDAHAELFAACRRRGHPLQNKLHTGDRWVAACAVAKALPLLAADGIYRDAPDLELVAISTASDGL